MPSRPATPYRRHAATYGPERAHRLPGTEQGPDVLHVWRVEDGAVVIQNDECDILVPAAALTRLAEALLAVHVHNGRPDAKASAT